MTKNFLRVDSARYSKLGKGRRKLQKWRKPKGRHNKMREKRRSYPKTVSIGYRKPKKERKETKLVNNIKDLKYSRKTDGIMLSARLGAKKKVELIKLAKEKGIKILNLGGKR